MDIHSKFKKDIRILESAAREEIVLPVKNIKLYKKVKRFYQQEGVVFSGDPEDDYEILRDYLYADLVAPELK